MKFQRRLCFIISIMVGIGNSATAADFWRKDTLFWQAQHTINIYSHPQQPQPDNWLAIIAADVLKQSCGEEASDAAPYADMFFFRAAIPLGLTPAEELRLTAAIAVADGPSALEFTAELRRDGNPLKRFAANLVALYVWGNGQKPLLAGEAQELFAKLETDLALMPEEAKADYYYLRSLAASEGRQAEQALDYANKAVLADKRFFNAHVIRLALLIDRAEQDASQLGGQCQIENQLGWALRSIVAFSPCALQSAHLALSLRNRQQIPDEHVSLLLTELFLATISKQKSAFERKARLLTQSAEQRVACKPSILNTISELRSLF